MLTMVSIATICHWELSILIETSCLPLPVDSSQSCPVYYPGLSTYNPHEHFILILHIIYILHIAGFALKNTQIYHGSYSFVICLFSPCL